MKTPSSDLALFYFHLDAISTAVHSVLTHPGNKKSYIRMLFVDFRSTLDTVSVMKLTREKLGLEH